MDTVAYVLAGGNVEGYGVLFHNRTKAALPFAGHYRIIDFALSNLSNSNITAVGILTQYLPASLIEHVAGGDAWDLHGYDRMVKIMPPFVGIGQTTWFQGTSDAVYRNLNLVYDLDPEDVIILSGEHIYQMDYNRALAFHREHDADLTIVALRMPREKLTLRYGYLKKDKDNRVTLFKEKPKDYLSDLVSIGIYIFKKDVLIKNLKERGETGSTQNLVFDVIEPMAAGPGVFAYEFDGYWDYLANVNHYYETSLGLLEKDPAVKPGPWEIVTNLEDRALGYRPPLYIGPSAETEQCLISPGCRIEGTVRNSVLSPGVEVQEGALVEDSILMHDCLIRKGAHIRGVVSDKNVLFGEDCTVGGKVKKEVRNPELPDVPSDLTIVGKGAIIGEKVNIGGYSQVYPDMDLGNYKGTDFAPGINIR